MFIWEQTAIDVINALQPKAMITWKSFLVCFDQEINTSFYSK